VYAGTKKKLNLTHENQTCINKSKDTIQQTINKNYSQVAMYDVGTGNITGLYLQTRSPYRVLPRKNSENEMSSYQSAVVHICYRKKTLYTGHT